MGISSPRVREFSVCTLTMTRDNAGRITHIEIRYTQNGYATLLTLAITARLLGVNGEAVGALVNMFLVPHTQGLLKIALDLYRLLG